MKKAIKVICLALGCGLAISGFAACDKGGGGGGKGNAITLVVWLPKEDQEFGKEVANAYKEANPDKKYNFQFGEQSESDA